MTDTPGLFDLPGDDADLVAAFWEYHRENPHIYRLFKRFALEAIDRGRKHLGAKMIFERIRWYTQVETTGDPFKINNNYHAYYARLFMRDHPDYDGFFRTRKAQGELA